MPRSRAISLAALLLVAACGDEPAAPLPVSSLEVVQGPPASVTPGADVVTVLLRATDAAGQPQSGAPVTWSVRSGGGTLEPLSERTGPDGLIAARWSIGPFVGEQRIAASLPTEAGLEIATDGTAFTADVVEAGNGFGCALRAGETWCFGRQAESVGTSGEPFGEAPRRLFPGIRATELAVADVSACVLDEVGAARCRGRTFGSSFGSGVQPIAGLPPLRGLTDGDYLFCGLSRADETAWCWSLTRPATQVSPTLRFLAFAAGGTAVNSLACGIAADGGIWCWRNGVLGREPDVPGAREIAVGPDFVCVLTATADAVCWGGTRVRGLTPTPRRLAGGVTRIHAGWTRIVLESAGQFQLFGGGDDESPALFARLRARDFSADDDFCAVAASGAVYCTPSAAGSSRTAPRVPDDPGFWDLAAVPVPAEN